MLVRQACRCGVLVPDRVDLCEKGLGTSIFFTSLASRRCFDESSRDSATFSTCFGKRESSMDSLANHILRQRKQLAELIQDKAGRQIDV
eukprot:2131806-Rhodomonas_salina.1